jgi:hypothetical protein
MSYIYRYEAKGIQSYILATDRLREMVGASSLIEALEEEVVKLVGKDVDKDVDITAAAGSATIEFKTHKALAAFASVWPMQVHKLAPGLQIIQAWIEKGEDWFNRLAEKLGEQRSLRWPSLPEPHPAMLRTGRTGLPAVDEGEEPETTLLDLPSKKKLDTYGRDNKAGKSGNDRLGSRLLKGLVDGPTGFISDNNALLEDKRFSYLAVVHADGNGIGSLLHTLKPEQYRAFSKALSAATEAAARRAVQATLLDSVDFKGKIRARPLVLGGDDLTILLPAGIALAFTRAYLDAFEQETKARQKELTRPLSAAAGIAIIKRRWPFCDAHFLAEQLCKLAKDDLKRSSGLAFQRVTTSLSDAPAEIFRFGSYGLAGQRTIDNLIALKRYICELPRGRLREWTRIVLYDPGRAELHWKRTREVMKKKPTALGSIDAVLIALGVDPMTGFEKESRGDDPDTGKPMKLRTPFADVLALMAVPEEK